MGGFHLEGEEGRGAEDLPVAAAFQAAVPAVAAGERSLQRRWWLLPRTQHL
jgi:hypothetical protein